MKLMILENVFNVVNNDTLKTSKKEWLLYFSSWLYWVDRNRYTGNPFCTISAEYLKKIFGNSYLQLITYFENNNWLIRIKSYIVGIESSKYEITLPVNCNLIPVDFNCKTVLNKLLKIQSGSLEYVRRKKIKDDEYVEYEEEDFTEFKCDWCPLDYSIDVDKEFYLNYRSVLDKVTSTVPDSLLKKIKYVEKRLEKLNTKKRFKYVQKLIIKNKKRLVTLNEEKHKLQDFHTENEMKSFSIDSFGNRAHTSFTRLKKLYRKFIKLNNEKLYQIDIVNAQPWLLSNMEEITDKREVKDILQFIDDCSNGCFYEKFLTEKISRDKVKTFIYQLLFGSYQKCSINDPTGRNMYNADIANKDSVLNKFISLYPTVWEFIEKYNEFNYKRLSYTLQRMESELMLFNTWNELYENNIMALTLHDAIFVNEKDLEFAMEILKKNIKLKNYSLPKTKN